MIKADGEEVTMGAIEMMTKLSMAQAESDVRAALAGQGFDVLTEIDVAATLRAKLGIERARLKILGALQLDESVSLLLPCNVVVAETGDGTKISAVDPRLLMPASASSTWRTRRQAFSSRRLLRCRHDALPCGIELSLHA